MVGWVGACHTGQAKEGVRASLSHTSGSGAPVVAGRAVVVAC